MDIYETSNRMRNERLTIHDLDLRVTFYARVSTERDEQTTSIEHQIEHFTEMIQKNPHWTYVQGYVDRTRGESAENRVQFMQMIHDGKADKFDLIITKEVSRFARNTIDSLTYTRDLLHSGVGVLFQNDNICTIDTDSELRLTIMSSIATDEVRKLSERIKFGHKKSIEQGVVMGNSRIFGYVKDNKRLVIDEEEAKMVRFIFEEYSTGTISTRGLERLLWDKGYRNTKGKRLNHNTITNIISNPKYKGYYCGNKVKIEDYRTKAQRFLPEDEWITYKDETGEIVPAIVSEELWDAANAIYRQRREEIIKLKRNPKATSVFSGKIRCSEHNENYWRSSYSHRIHPDSNIYQWICKHKKVEGAQTCASFSIYETELYAMMDVFYKKLLKNMDEYINAFAKLAQETSQSNNTAKQIQSLKDSIMHEEKKKEKLMDLYTEDLITKADFIERNTKVCNALDEMSGTLLKLETEEKCGDKTLRYLLNVKKYLLTREEDTCQDENVDGEQTNETVKNQGIDYNYIDRLSAKLLDSIIVEPVSESVMNIHIILKMGVEETITLNKLGRKTFSRSSNLVDDTVLRSGHTIKKVSPERSTNVATVQYDRSNVTKLKHSESKTYCLSMQIG